MDVNEQKASASETALLWLFIISISAAIMFALMFFSVASDCDKANKRYYDLRVEAVKHGAAKWEVSDEGWIEFKWVK